VNKDADLTKAVRELAHRLGGPDELAIECGVRPHAVAGWMNGERSPSLHMRFVLDVIAQRVGMLPAFVPCSEGRTPPPSHSSGVRKRLTNSPHETPACGAVAGGDRAGARARSGGRS
jgi:hypothetical protein